ncbi:unnamed protein product [Protopolystoma xenopodis]|uniref:Secreted protein n=1 Tax=Protopolystoma xenopodis TaxID=117903 RepID=A0A448X600_9PLAT|nr:unnamed protein product [Protopolystoma xenopodis]
MYVLLGTILALHLFAFNSAKVTEPLLLPPFALRRSLFLPDAHNHSRPAPPVAAIVSTGNKTHSRSRCSLISRLQLSCCQATWSTRDIPIID